MDSGLQRKDINWTFYRVIRHSFVFDYSLVDFKEATIAKDKNASWPKFISTSPSFTSSIVPQKVSFARIPTSIWLKYSSWSHAIFLHSPKSKGICLDSRESRQKELSFCLETANLPLCWNFTLWHRLYNKVQEKFRFLFTMRELCTCYRVFFLQNEIQVLKQDTKLENTAIIIITI